VTAFTIVRQIFSQRVFKGGEGRGDSLTLIAGNLPGGWPLVQAHVRPDEERPNKTRRHLLY